MNMNRETWLNTITQAYLVKHFASKGYTIPANVRLSASFTSRGAGMRKGQKARRIGECWVSSASADNTIEIMISPVIEDSVKAVGILIHELVHATVGNENGHNAVFKRCANAVGLAGKMTATTESPELVELITQWVADVGSYPHAKLNDNIGKQSTRMYRCKCRSAGCGYTMRISSKWLKVAIPSCPACDSTMGSPFGDSNIWGACEDDSE
jgi:hypothetical protein